MGKERTDADEEVGDNYRPTLTKSELKFFERQRKREMDRILLKVIIIVDNPTADYPFLGFKKSQRTCRRFQ